MTDNDRDSSPTRQRQRRVGSDDNNDSNTSEEADAFTTEKPTSPPNSRPSSHTEQVDDDPYPDDESNQYHHFDDARPKDHDNESNQYHQQEPPSVTMLSSSDSSSIQALLPQQELQDVGPPCMESRLDGACRVEQRAWCSHDLACPLARGDDEENDKTSSAAVGPGSAASEEQNDKTSSAAAGPGSAASASRISVPMIYPRLSRFSSDESASPSVGFIGKERTSYLPAAEAVVSAARGDLHALDGDNGGIRNDSDGNEKLAASTSSGQFFVSDAVSTASYSAPGHDVSSLNKETAMTQSRSRSKSLLASDILDTISTSAPESDVMFDAFAEGAAVVLDAVSPTKLVRPPEKSHDKSSLSAGATPKRPARQLGLRQNPVFAWAFKRDGAPYEYLPEADVHYRSVQTEDVPILSSELRCKVAVNYDVSIERLKSVAAGISWGLVPEGCHSDWAIEIYSSGSGKEISSKTYYVHRNVLAFGPYSGEYFTRLFQHREFSESLESVSRIELDPLGAAVFPKLLDHCYKGVTPGLFDDTSVLCLHQLGDYFQMQRLCADADEHWKSHLSDVSLELYYEQAVAFRNDQVLEAVKTRLSCSIVAMKFLELGFVTNKSIEVEPGFWLEVLEQAFPHPPLQKLSFYACRIVLKVTARILESYSIAIANDFFQRLTAKKFLPAIDSDLAWIFLELHAKLAKMTASETEDTSNSPSLSCLQKRCVAVIAENWDQQTPESVASLSREQSPLLSAELLSRVMLKAKSDKESMQVELTNIKQEFARFKQKHSKKTTPSDTMNDLRDDDDESSWISA
jgi:hypothetical protein